MEKALLNLLLKQGGQRYISWREDTETGMIRVTLSDPNKPNSALSLLFKLE